MNLKKVVEQAIEALQSARSVFNGEGDTIGGCGCEVQPLYPAPPKREPLTEEQIEFRFGKKPTRYMLFLIRSTERAHGIGGEE